MIAKVAKRADRIYEHPVWASSKKRYYDEGYVRTKNGLVLVSIFHFGNGKTTLEFVHNGFDHWWRYNKSYSRQYTVTLAKRMAAEISGKVAIELEGGVANDSIDIVFDGPPGPKSGRFVEVEDSAGRSIKFGEWIKRDDGYWALRFSLDDSSECVTDQQTGE